MLVCWYVFLIKLLFHHQLLNTLPTPYPGSGESLHPPPQKRPGRVREVRHRQRDREILSLAWPAVLGASIDPLLSLLDTYWVSRCRGHGGLGSWERRGVLCFRNHLELVDGGKLNQQCWGH